MPDAIERMHVPHAVLVGDDITLFDDAARDIIPRAHIIALPAARELHRQLTAILNLDSGQKLGTYYKEIHDLGISEHDRSHIGETLSEGDWWSADLLRLIAKSDPRHRAALRVLFPSHVEAYEAWHDGPTP